MVRIAHIKNLVFEHFLDWPPYWIHRHTGAKAVYSRNARFPVVMSPDLREELNEQIRLSRHGTRSRDCKAWKMRGVRKPALPAGVGRDFYGSHLGNA